MNEVKYYCDVCNKEVDKYKLFDLAIQLTERTNSNLQGQRTIEKLEICIECLEKEGIKPTNKKTMSDFGLNEYKRNNNLENLVGLIKKWFKI